jgi:rod shape-determining protein MreC
VNRSRSRRVLVLLVLAAITLLTLDRQGWGPLQRTRGEVVDGIRPVIGPADGFLAPVEDAWNGIFNYGDVADQNAELRQRVAELETREAFVAEKERELGRESNERGLTWTPGIQAVDARVITTRPSNYEQTVQLDRGSASGIRPGHPVVNGLGVVGRVVQVSDTTALVRLITDPQTRVAVKAGTEADPSLIRGQGPDNPLSVDLRSQNNSANEPTVFVGDLVFTNGIAESLFPAGLPVAEVTRVRVREGTQVYDIEAEPIVDLDRLEYVTVLLYTPPPLTRSP